MDTYISERLSLSGERISQIPAEKVLTGELGIYFEKTAEWILSAMAYSAEGKDPDALKEANTALYAQILPDAYARSYVNPAYSTSLLGESGRYLAFLSRELLNLPVYLAEGRTWDGLIGLELFLEVYSACCDEGEASPKQLKGILSSYMKDYLPQFSRAAVKDFVDPEDNIRVKRIMEEDLFNPSYLYKYGIYVTEDMLGVQAFLAKLPQEEIDAMARTYTEGFRMSFIQGRKDLSIKRTVEIRFMPGFERMVKAAILQFEQMGLKSTVKSCASHNYAGMLGELAYANRQIVFDHKEDDALFLDEDFVTRRLRASQEAYESMKEMAGEHAGPAVIETFGEDPFEPAICAERFTRDDRQKQQWLDMKNELAQITHRYIRGEERSFTIIAYPVPSIGEKFEEIFAETVRINNLDYFTYQKIQQTIIDTLDTCEWVEIKGAGDNETDLLIHLHELKDPARETNFENCVADCNIPVGEVFTSPQLAGTGGILHVQRVYLNGLEFKELRLVFDCGQVIDYSCENFESEEENRKYIEENILFHHRKIPMGEFAIGTNTTAYVVAQKYNIFDRMPILIAEKMGPHFAVGDTCYSWSEDIAVYNPDGKECIARENEISALRKEDLSMAYYSCHTDITIPYDELGSIRVIDDEGDMVSIIEDGRFVLPGTEELNLPFEA